MVDSEHDDGQDQKKSGHNRRGAGSRPARVSDLLHNIFIMSQDELTTLSGETLSCLIYALKVMTCVCHNSSLLCFKNPRQTQNWIC